MVLTRINQMLNEHSGKEKQQTSKTGNKNGNEQCMECRLIGGGGLTCLGVWLIYFVQKRDYRLSKGKKSVIFGTGLGILLSTIGVIRLIDIR